MSLSLWSAFGAGVAAGLGVAMPVGAVGILLLDEGMTWRTRRALPASTAVACVDTAYCALAVMMGAAAAPRVRALGAWPVVVGALMLAGIAVLGIARTLRSATRRFADPEPGTHHRDGATCLRFTLITAVNPMTLLYFAALIAALGDLSTPLVAATFTVGTGLASLAWQSGLVVTGALLGTRLSARTRRTATLAAHAGVGVVAVVLLVRTLS